MKKSLYAFCVVLSLCVTVSNAQSWAENMAFRNVLPAGFCASKIRAVSDKVVWVFADNQCTSNGNAAAWMHCAAYTTNGGTTWQLTTTANGSITSIDAVDSTTAWISFTASIESGMHKTTDGGRTWVKSLSTAPNSKIIRFLDKNNGVAMGTQSALRALTTDGGTTWQSEANPTAPYAGERLIGRYMARIKDTLWWTSSSGTTSTRAAKLYRSVNKGATWSVTGADIPITRLWSVQFVDFRDSKNGLLLGADLQNGKTGGVMKTSDGGDSWEATTGPTGLTGVLFPELRYITNSKNSYVIIGIYQNELSYAYTDNGGATWTNFDYIPSPSDFTVWSSVEFSSPSMGWLAFTEVGGSNKLFKLSYGASVPTKEISETLRFSISPNPSTGNINIQWRNVNNTPPQYLRVSDALGHIIFEKKGFDSGTTSQSIDLKGIANGLYFVELQTPNNRSVEKLMIQH